MTHKVAVGQGAVMAVFMLFILVTFIETLMAESATERASTQYRATIALRSAHADMVDINGLVRGIMLTQNDFLVQVYEDTDVRYQKNFRKFMQLIEGDEKGVAMGRKVRDAFETLKEKVYSEQMRLAMSGEEGNIDKAIAYETEGKAYEYLETVLFTIADLIEHQEAKQAQAEAAMRDAFFSQKVSLGIAAILAILLAIALSRLTGRRIAQPVEDITGAMRAIAGGDKKQSIPHQGRGDEIGAMAKTVVVFRDAMVETESLAEETRRQQEKQAEESARAAEEERRRVAEREEAAERRQARADQLEELVRDFENRILTSVGNMESASTDMRQTADDMAESAQSTQEQVTRVSRTSSEMQSEASGMKDAVEGFTQAMQSITEHMEQADSLSSEASEASRRGATTVEKLTEASGKIGAVVELIDDIAEQTNMLALNATIEAARAGDAGKGFAVVAGEVKSLASQTANATADISTQVKAMQNVSEEVRKAITTADEQMTELAGVLRRVVGTIQEQYSATDQLSRAATVTQQGSDEVASGLEQVTGGADQASAAAADVLSAIEKLEQTAQTLRTDVDGFLSDYSKID